LGQQALYRAPAKFAEVAQKAAVILVQLPTEFQVQGGAFLFADGKVKQTQKEAIGSVEGVQPNDALQNLDGIA
jgi:hypothetical protein